MLAKVCPSCGRVHATGDRCPVRDEMRKLYDKNSDREIRKWRNGPWKKIRAYVAARDGGCLVCMDEGCAPKDDRVEVHHIIPIAINFALADDETNLITLCRWDHELAEKGELKRDYLRDLTAASIKRYCSEGGWF